MNNLAVALLGQGKLKEVSVIDISLLLLTPYPLLNDNSDTKQGIEVLEAALQASPATLTMAEPFLFNLCAFPLPFFTSILTSRSYLHHAHIFDSTATLYELRSAVAADKKRNLLIEVAKWSGDGLRTTCLKMPAN